MSRANEAMCENKGKNAHYFVLIILLTLRKLFPSDGRKEECTC